jgi:hypothetical protein
MALAFSCTLIMIGLVASPSVFIIGILAAAISGVEWTIQAWADSATGDPAVNALVRNRLMRPLEVPVGAIIGIAVVVLCISRIFLATAGAGAIVIALALAAVVFLGAVILSAQPQIRRTAVVAAVLFFAVAVLAIGIGGAVAGPAEHHEHKPPPAAEQIETGAPADSVTLAALGETD